MKDYLRVFKQIDTDLLTGIKDTLKLFKDLTTLMSSESTCTVSLVRPFIAKLLAHLKPDPSREDPTAIHEARARMFHDLETR